MVNPLHMKVFARAESAEEVRAVLRGWLAGRVPERELGDAELVATELVAHSSSRPGRHCQATGPGRSSTCAIPELRSYRV